MRKSRVLVIGALTIAIWSASSTAAFADDPPPADPPPAAEPPPAPAPPPVPVPEPAPTRTDVPVPYSPPVIETPPSVPQGVFYAPVAPEEEPPHTGLTLEQSLAASRAFREQHMAAIHRLMQSLKPGQSINIELDGRVTINENGGPIDLATAREVSLADYGAVGATSVDLDALYASLNPVESAPAAFVELTSKPEDADKTLAAPVLSAEPTSATISSGPSEWVLIAITVVLVGGYRVLLRIRRPARA